MNAHFVTVLFADLVGSTSLYRRHGDEAADALRRDHFAALRGAVAEHGGREVKSTGDGLMAAFSSAVAAVRCAVDMQRATTGGGSGLELRVGLDAGEPLADDDDLYGTPVIVARRLCDAAGAGEIIASETVCRIAVPRISHLTEPLAALRLEGLAQPTAVAQIRWREDMAPPQSSAESSDAVSKTADVRSPAPLLEREVELARIGGRLAEARAGKGTLLVIEGPAGIGKTSLARALREEATEHGMRVLHARGAELEAGFAFGVLRQLLEPALAALDDGARAEATSGQAAHALRTFEPAGDEAAPVEAVLNGVYWLVVNLADHGSLVLVVDDAQWADASSIEALAFIARRLEPLPLALVLATRPPDVDALPALAALVGDPSAEVLRPSPLGHPGIAELARSDDAAFVAAAAEATGGNPFLLDQLLRELGAARSAEAVAAAQPRDLARIVLGRLSGAGRALARSLAVLGDAATLHECGALAEISNIESAAQELMRATVLDDDALRFRHPLLAAAVEADLAGPRRGIWHARAAAALSASGADPERIALHLARTEPRGDTEAARTLHRAATLARARGAPAEAAELLRRTMAEPPAEADRDTVALDLGHVLALLGDPTAPSVLLALARTTSDPGLRADALATGSPLARPEEAPAHLAEFDAAIAEASGAVRARLEAARLSVGARDLAEIGTRVERAEAEGLFDRTENPSPHLFGYLAWWRAATGTSAERCGELAERAAGLVLRGEGPLLFDLWIPLTLVVLRHAERFEAALALTDRLEHAAVSRGSSAWYAMMRVSRSQLERAAGQLLDAEADATAAVEAADAAGTDRWMRALPYGELVHVLVERGHVGGAEETLERLEIGAQIPSEAAFADVLLARASLSHARGRLHAALHDLEALDALAPPSILSQDARRCRALVARDRGDQASASASAREALEIAERWGTPGAIGSALRVLGLIEQDSTMLERAVEKLSESPLRVEHAVALADLGALRRRANARREARVPLREALTIARDCGADGLAARVEEELEATGAKVPARPGGGVASLTPSEARIARLAADGLSNKEIAQSLFVTVKTVEFHLRHCYQKLEIERRTELEAALS